MARFPKCKSVANTYRFDADKNALTYYTTLLTNDNFYESREFTSNCVVDRSGSGDCFMGGLIYGFHNASEPQQTLDFATAAAFGKLQERGDSTAQDELEVKTLNNKGRSF